MRNYIVIGGLAVGLAGCATAPGGGVDVAIPHPMVDSTIRHVVAPKKATHKVHVKTAVKVPPHPAVAPVALPVAPAAAPAPAPAVATPLSKPRWYDRFEAHLHNWEGK